MRHIAFMALAFISCVAMPYEAAAQNTPAPMLECNLNGVTAHGMPGCTGSSISMGSYSGASSDNGNATVPIDMPDASGNSRCRYVDNISLALTGTAQSVFVPFNTPIEWAAFYSNAPNYINIVHCSKPDPINLWTVTPAPSYGNCTNAPQVDTPGIYARYPGGAATSSLKPIFTGCSGSVTSVQTSVSWAGLDSDTNTVSWQPTASYGPNTNLAVSAGGGPGTPGVPITVLPHTPVTLTWNVLSPAKTANASSTDGTWSGPVSAASNFQVVTPNPTLPSTSTVYTYTVTDSNNLSTTTTATVNVVQGMSVTLTATPTTVPLGSPTQLTWKIIDPSGLSDSCTPTSTDNTWTSPTITASGTQSVTPNPTGSATSTTYTLTCSNSLQSGITASVKVNVSAMSASCSSPGWVDSGSADYCPPGSINGYVNGIPAWGPINGTAGCSNWSYGFNIVPFNGETCEVDTGTPLDPTACAPQTYSKSADILEVYTYSATGSCPGSLSVALAATPTTVVAGSPTNLTWTITDTSGGPDSCVATSTDGSWVSPAITANGSQSVIPNPASPATTTTYTLICSNSSQSGITGTVTVTVTPLTSGGGVCSVPSAPTSCANGTGHMLFTSSGTFTPPTNVTYPLSVRVLAVGGGQGGYDGSFCSSTVFDGSIDYSGNGGGGGGGGSLSTATITLPNAASIPVTVAPGGSPGGLSPASSSFGSYLTSMGNSGNYGGGGGLDNYDESSSYVANGSSGSGGGACVSNLTGATITFGAGGGGGGAGGGGGGGLIFNIGGTTYGNTEAGQDSDGSGGTGFGAGGGGGSDQGGGNNGCYMGGTGGTGAPGAVYIEWCQ